jgi:predicted DNA-binding protein with PD1-like motif
MLRNASVVFVLSASVTLVACSGTQTRREVVKATTPFDDGKPNSSAVPDGYAITSAFDKVVVLRFKFDVDLLDGIERQVKTLGIRNAVILSGIGSVRGYHVHSVSNRTFPSKNVFVKDPTASADIVSMNGYVIGGRVHAHVTLADPDRAFGGHLERETRVFTFAVVTLGVLREPVDLERVDDKTYR